MNSVEILKNTPLSAKENMRIVSDVLDPIIAQPHLVRFQIPNAGILRPDSILVFKVQSETDDDCFFPLKTGCYSAFQKVELMLGSRRLQVVEKSALHSTIKNQFKPCEEAFGLDMVQNGVVKRLCNNEADDGRMTLKDVVVKTATDDQVPKRFRIRKNNPQEWSVKMSSLFSILENLSLPLSDLHEPLFVNLYLNKGEDVAVFSKGYSGDKSVSVLPSSFQLVADILYFSDERMRQLNEDMMTDEGINMIVDDVITITQQVSTKDVSSETAPVERIINSDLALNGMSVKNIVISDKNTGYTNADAGLLGKYTSQAYVKPDTIQVRVNDLNVYPRKVVNEQRKIQEVENCFEDYMYVSNPEFSFNQVSRKENTYAVDNKMFEDTKTIHGYKLSESITGMSHYTGVDLSVDRRGRQGVVANKKINIVRETYPSPVLSNDDERELTFFATCEKMVQFRNGGVVMVN